MKDIDRFLYELENPPRGMPKNAVTEADLDQDAESFMAFAGAFGVSPQRALAARNETPPADDVIS